jgi:type I restriction enzyme, S subunit
MIPKERRAGWQYWEVADLLRDGFIQIGDGYRAKNSEMGEPGLPFARAGNLNNGFHFDDADILKEESVRLAGEKISRLGDITFTSKGTFGRFAFVHEDTPPFVYSPQLCYWRVKREGVVDRKFLYYWMQGADCLNQLNEVKGLTDMADYVSLTNQRKMWLSAPPLPTQGRIVSILSAYDDLIENNQRRIRILEEMARAIYLEWFVYFRFPGHDTVPRVPSPLGPIPQGWDASEFRDLFDIRYGKTLPKTDISDSGLFPVYGAGDVIGFHNELLCHAKVALVTSRGNGSGTVWRTREEAFVTNNSLIVLPRSEFAHWDYSFIELLLKHSDVMQVRTGSAQPQVTIENLNYLKAIVPTKPLVERFCAVVTPIYEQVDLLFGQIQNLRRTRDLLLPRLLSGGLAINNPTQSTS